MPAQQQIIEALKELESDLRHSGISSGAIIYPDSQRLPEGARAVFESLSKLEGALDYSQNCVDARFIEGSDYRLESISMTGEVMINTLAGKLVLPKGIKLRLMSKR